MKPSIRFAFPLSLSLALAAPAGAQTAAQWVATGRALVDSGKSDAAVTAFEHAVKLEPNSSANHMLLVNALGTVAQKASVIKQPFMARRIKSELDIAHTLAPQSLDPYLGLIDFYTQAPAIMGGSMAKAREQAAHIAKLSVLRGHFANATIALADKDTATAEREYRAAITDAPDSLVVYTQLAFWYNGAKRPADAFATMDRWLEHRPGDAIGGYYVGRLAGLTGQQLDRGEKLLRTYIAVPPSPDDKTRPGIPLAHVRLGDILAKKGDKPGARKEYDEALRLNPQLDAARKALSALK